MVLALSDQLRNRGTPSAKSGEGGQCVGGGREMVNLLFPW